jgi:hypothetical protein
MTLASDGYTLIEHYINWMGDLHAMTNKNVAIDIDLAPYTGGFQAVTPTYAVSGAAKGTVTLLSNGHTVHFTPATDYTGMASFSFTVTGSDNSTFTHPIAIAVVPSSVVTNVDEDISLAQAHNPYPNPASHTLYLPISEVSGYEIHDALGRLVGKNNQLRGESIQQIDISALNDGIFTLSVSLPNQNKVYRFVKRH